MQEPPRDFPTVNIFVEIDDTTADEPDVGDESNNVTVIFCFAENANCVVKEPRPLLKADGGTLSMRGVPNT